MPENVKPTIQGRDFVVATVAAPTVFKEPEKPAEEAAAEGAEGAVEGAEGTTTEAATKEGGDKAPEGEKGKEDPKKDQKAPAEKK